jgi:hypothetical protein
MNNRYHIKNLRLFLIWALAAVCSLIVISVTDAADKADKIHVKALDGIPEDLYIVYSTGATHAEWGRTTYEISADGGVVYEESRGLGNKGSRQTKCYRLTEKELKTIVKTIRENNFFDMNQHYSHPHIMDGWSSSIVVTLDHKTHSVSVMNLRQREFDTIAYVIKSIIDKKRPIKLN